MTTYKREILMNFQSKTKREKYNNKQLTCLYAYNPGVIQFFACKKA